MKKYFSLVFTLVLSQFIFAQAPTNFNYQAVIRDGDGAIAAERNIGIQISIIKSTIGGTAVYTERHFPTTNTGGVATISIGAGTVITGDFASIDWSDGPYFIKTETDLNGGSNYSISGTSQLLTVPYALHAQTVEEKQRLSISGNKLSISDGNEVTLPASQGGTASKTYFVISGDISQEAAAQRIQNEVGSNTQFILVTNTTNITSLDFSNTGISELVEFEVEKNDALETINFPTLKHTFKDLDISENPNLTTLNISNLESVEDLSIDRNTSLTTIDLDKLNYTQSINLTENGLVTYTIKPISGLQVCHVSADKIIYNPLNGDQISVYIETNELDISNLPMDAYVNVGKTISGSNLKVIGYKSTQTLSVGSYGAGINSVELIDFTGTEISKLQAISLKLIMNSVTQLSKLRPSDPDYQTLIIEAPSLTSIGEVSNNVVLESIGNLQNNLYTFNLQSNYNASSENQSKTLQTLVDKDLRSGNISLYYDENYDSPEIPIQDQNNIDTLRSRGVTISINNY